MIPLASLWLPILLSAVIVFLASWILHMFVPHHRIDFKKLPQEDAVLDALRAMNIPSGQYLAPYCNTAAQMKQPEYVEKRKRGPAFFLTYISGAAPGMGKPLAQWFVFLIVVSIICACLAAQSFAPGAAYMTVFKFVAVAAFLTYGLSHIHQSIWYHQYWGMTINYLIDGLIYALLTAGVFGWLWPK